MSSSENKLLQQALAPAFKAVGYRKIGATWRLDDNEFIRVFNIQGSQFSKTFYLNLGIYIRALGDSVAPTEAHCHVSRRLSDVVPSRERLHALLDFEQPIPNGQRTLELAGIIEQYAIPWLTNHASISSLRSLLAETGGRGLLVGKEVWSYVGLKARA